MNRKEKPISVTVVALTYCRKCKAAITEVADSGRCEPCERETRRAKNREARLRHQAMTDLGLVRVRGGLGGVYYE